MLKPIFLIFFTGNWPVADMRLATDTDIPNFAYRYIYRYFKVFWLKLVVIAYSSDLRHTVNFLFGTALLLMESGCYFHPNENYPHEVEISTNLVEIFPPKIKFCSKIVTISACLTKSGNIHPYVIEKHHSLLKGGMY